MIIYCHPTNAAKLKKQLRDATETGVTTHAPLYGIPIDIRESPYMPLECDKPGGWTKNHFPNDRFVEYEDSDMEWMLPLGYPGAWVEREQQLAYFEVDDTTLVMNQPEWPPATGASFQECRIPMVAPLMTGHGFVHLGAT